MQWFMEETIYIDCGPIILVSGKVHYFPQKNLLKLKKEIILDGLIVFTIKYKEKKYLPLSMVEMEISLDVAETIKTL